MIPRMGRAAGVLALGVGLTCTTVSGQQTIGVGMDYIGYTLDEGLGADAVQLFMMPLAVRVPLGDVLSLDVAATWAQGKVEKDGTRYTLQGLTDTRLKLSWSASPWALVSFGASLPTGNWPYTDSGCR